MTELGQESRLKENHILAVLGRLALLVAGAILITAAIVQPPRIIYSYHAQHFAAFYAISVGSAAAFKRAKLSKMAIALGAFAILFEAARSLMPLHAHTSYANAFADGAGVIAALAPMLVQKFRGRF